MVILEPLHLFENIHDEDNRRPDILITLVDAVNASSNDDRTSTQRDDQLAANSSAAHNFIEDLDLSLINQDHRQH